MKRSPLVVFAAALTFATAAFAADEAASAPAANAAPAARPAGKSCDDLKSEIAAKLDARHVANYTLDIVGKDDQHDGKAVGTCGGGTKKIVYTRK